MKIVNRVITLITVCVLTCNGGNGADGEVTLGQKARVVVYVDEEMRPSLQKLALGNGFDYLGRVKNPDPMWDGYYVLEGKAIDAEMEGLKSIGIEHVMMEKMVKLH